MAGDPKFEIASFYPELEDYYGVLIGLCYSLPLAITGVYNGSLSAKMNRKWLLAGAIGFLSLL